MSDLSSPQMGEFFKPEDTWVHGAGKTMNGNSDGTARLAGTTPPYRWDRRDSAVSGPTDRSHHPASTLGRFPARGMTTLDLALAQSEFTRYARTRITGVGAEQYDNGHSQKFEEMSVSELVTETLDELADVVNYCTFLAVQLQRLQQRVEAAQ